jgi:hypothetical protein
MAALRRWSVKVFVQLLNASSEAMAGRLLLRPGEDLEWQFGAAFVHSHVAEFLSQEFGGRSTSSAWLVGLG